MRQPQIGDYIKSKTCGVLIGKITGEGTIPLGRGRKDLQVWVIENCHGDTDVVEKDDAKLLGYWERDTQTEGINE